MGLSTSNIATNNQKDHICLYLQEKAKGIVECKAFLDYEEICFCKVNTDSDEESWTISSWFTNENMQGKGIGKKTLANVLLALYLKNGTPKKIQYIWNGTNKYVLEWMERHFDAECSCPVAVLKLQADDDWESHIYNLDVDKVLKYFEIK